MPPQALRAEAWTNWSGSAHCQPRALQAPRSEAELAELVRTSQGPIRLRGAGHSFTPLCCTEGQLISLDHMPGALLSYDAEAGTARLQAGASLNALSKAMHDAKLGFHNLGDIDVQSLAGAVMTATHGTGVGFPCLAGEIRAMRMMDARGEIHEVTAQTPGDLLNAARVSLGALGILLEANVSVAPAYKLKRHAAPRPIRDLLQEAPTLWAAHRNFEFFALPHSDHALAITHDLTDAPDCAENVGDDMSTLRQLKLLRSLTKRLPGLRRRIMNMALGGTKPETIIGPSWQLLANERSMRFHEMEYHVPEAGALDLVRDVLKLIETRAPEVFFPVEVRKTAADPGWLSPFHDGPRVSIAVHAHQADAYEWMFTQIEPLFREAGGRPHWGKLHSLTASDLSALYPKYEAFCQLRAELDPEGRFLNPHLRALFDLPKAQAA